MESWEFVNKIWKIQGGRLAGYPYYWDSIVLQSARWWASCRESQGLSFSFSRGRHSLYIFIWRSNWKAGNCVPSASIQQQVLMNNGLPQSLAVVFSSFSVITLCLVSPSSPKPTTAAGNQRPKRWSECLSLPRFNWEIEVKHLISILLKVCPEPADAVCL